MKLQRIDMKKTLTLLTLILSVFITKAQDFNDSKLPSFPEPLVFLDQDGFYKVMGVAAASVIISELIFNEVNANYYQVRSGFYGADDHNVFNQQFGIEKHLSHWFATGIEFNAQQWSGTQRGMGIGLNGTYRWYAFGKKRLSPFIEYGTGFFYGFSPFPAEGTKFTFHLTSNLGLEYTLKNENKMRLTYGHLHQSNNGLLEPNPGYDATGFTFTYLWNWKKK